VRTRWELWNWFEPAGTEDNDYDFFGVLARFGASGRMTGSTSSSKARTRPCSTFRPTPRAPDRPPWRLAGESTARCG